MSLQETTCKIQSLFREGCRDRNVKRFRILVPLAPDTCALRNCCELVCDAHERGSSLLGRFSTKYPGFRDSKIAERQNH